MGGTGVCFRAYSAWLPAGRSRFSPAAEFLCATTAPGPVIALSFPTSSARRCLPVTARARAGVLVLRYGATGCREGGIMNGFDVRVYAIRRRQNRRRPFEVRWHAAVRAWSRSSITRGWPIVTGPNSSVPPAAAWNSAAEPGTRPLGRAGRWHRDLAGARGRVRGHEVAAGVRAHRAGIATITPALTSTGGGRPPAAVLRAALYQQAFNLAGPALIPARRPPERWPGRGITRCRWPPWLTRR